MKEEDVRHSQRRSSARHSLFSRLSKHLNTLSTPFSADDGTGEDDYALLPPPCLLGPRQLTATIFFAVCCSAYGIEEAVSAGGPRLAIGTLLGVTLVWSLPMVLVVSELCACRA